MSSPDDSLLSALRGDWLGHPVHPALSDVPIGGWAASVALDTFGLAVAKGDRGWQRAADTSLGVALAAGMPTMLTGMADLLTRTSGPTRRAACLHGCVQCTALAAGAASLVARITGRRRIGVVLSAFGFALVGMGAWLGGELVFTQAVGVSNGGEEVDADGSGSP